MAARFSGLDNTSKQHVATFDNFRDDLKKIAKGETTNDGKMKLRSQQMIDAVQKLSAEQDNKLRALEELKMGDGNTQGGGGGVTLESEYDRLT